MNTTAFDSAIKALIQHTQFLPSDQIISELELVQERLKFMPDLLKQKSDHIATSLAEILRGDISPELLAAVTEMTSQDQFDVVRANADLFLEACQRELEQYEEVVIIVAVALTDNFKQTIANQVRTRIKKPVRVIFQTSPAIIAGCVVHEPGGESYDYSVRTRALPLARRQLKRKLSAEATV